MPTDDGSDDSALSRARARARASAAEARRRAAQAASTTGEAAKAAGQKAGEAAERGATATAAGARAAGRAAERHVAEDINVDAFVDERRKSRAQSFTEAAEHAATMAPPTNHTLSVYDGLEGPAAMAKTGMGLSFPDRVIETGDGGGDADAPPLAAIPALSPAVGMGPVPMAADEGMLLGGYDLEAEPADADPDGPMERELL